MKEFVGIDEKTLKEEIARALLKSEQGEDCLDEFSKRIMKKLLHPLYNLILEQTKTPFDIESNRREYDLHYSSKNRPVADHMDKEKFD